MKRAGSRYRASQRCSCRTSATLAYAVNLSAAQYGVIVWMLILEECGQLSS
jgi:hypothetical protein